MTFKQLDLKFNTKDITISINGIDIHVKTKISIKDKIDLVQIALQKSKENGIYNQMKLDIYFNLNLLYLYTDIDFDADDRANEEELYDILESNNVFDRVIAAIDPYEMDFLYNNLETMKKRYIERDSSVSALLQTLVEELPQNAQEAAEIVDNFDPEAYQRVIEFAKAANGGRDIPQS